MTDKPKPHWLKGVMSGGAPTAASNCLDDGASIPKKETRLWTWLFHNDGTGLKQLEAEDLVPDDMPTITVLMHTSTSLSDLTKALHRVIEEYGEEHL